MNDQKYLKAELESTIVYYIRPHFLTIEFEEDFFHIILCHPKFTNLSIEHRVNSVFALLRHTNSDILEKYTVVVECYAPTEMQWIFDNLGEKIC
jgi:hypothetical protein